jgi:hypothetical protein
MVPIYQGKKGLCQHVLPNQCENGVKRPLPDVTDGVAEEQQAFADGRL